MSESDEELQMLQYTCLYQAHVNKVGGKENALTWGDIIRTDYPHFKDLMEHHVGKDTQTFELLLPHVRPEDVEECKGGELLRDSDEETKKKLPLFLQYKCNHKSRYNGKTWQWILNNQYKYYVWSIANTMGRETSSFKILSHGLQPKDRDIVMSTAKGQWKRSMLAK